MSQNLLFVDDDNGDIQLTLLGFRLHQFEPHVIVAKDGKEALDILISDCEASRPLPHALLTDIKMPRMDGLELIRRVKSEPRLRAIPVAILTSSDHEDDRKEALRLGANYYFMKPSDLDAYAGIVSRMRELMEAGSTRGAGTDGGQPGP